jgi:hypothetical protein
MKYNLVYFLDKKVLLTTKHPNTQISEVTIRSFLDDYIIVEYSDNEVVVYPLQSVHCISLKESV